MAFLLEKPRHLCREHYLLRIRHDGSPSMPGQFVSLKTCVGTDPLLRRPFSIFNHEKDVIEVVIKIVGRGTEALCRMEQGTIDLLGPLGRPFTVPENERILIAGGGVGNAPLYYLGKTLKERGNSLFYIYGTRSRDYIYMEKAYSTLFNDILFTTDDGSAGSKGSVTEALMGILSREQFSRIYTCGPTVMMKAVTEAAGSLPVEVSVENYFGCGIGLCMGCTIETEQGLKRACVDGPVFSGSDVIWDTLMNRR